MTDKYHKRNGPGQDGNGLMKLVIFNAVLFVILKFIYVIYLSVSPNPGEFYKNVFDWFAMPANLHVLGSRPWAILTYMFTDEHVFRFIANMFWLWAFGYILQDLAGNRKLIPLYVFAGLFSAAFYIIAYHVFPKLNGQISTAFLAGANPSVMAIAIAATAIASDYRIFPMINGGIPLWILTAVYILISFSSIAYGDAGAYIANISAAFFGFMFIQQMKKGNDWSAWINVFFDWLADLFNPDTGKDHRSPKEQFFYKVSGTQPFKKIPNITQKRIDDILDKINQEGYRYLTDEEKEILKRAADKEDL